MDKIILATVADFLINLAAAWVGVAIILPIGLRELSRLKINWVVLTFDLVVGIVSLLGAMILRSFL